MQVELFGSSVARQAWSQTMGMRDGYSCRRANGCLMKSSSAAAIAGPLALLPLVCSRFCGHMEYDESSTRLSLSGPTAPSITREPLTNAESFDRSQ